MKGKRSAVFLDRDGTINVDYGYVYQPDKLKFIDGAPEGLKLLQEAGYLLVIVTNQSGIARGYFGLAEMEEFHKKMLCELKKYGVEIAKIYYCPHLDGCDCRKPKLKLFYDAQKELDIDFDLSYVVGDNMRDLTLCESENVRGFLLTEKAEASHTENSKITSCKNLLEAAKIISGSRGKL